MSQSIDTSILIRNRKIISDIKRKIAKGIANQNLNKDKIAEDIVNYLTQEEITDIIAIKNGKNCNMAQIFIVEEYDDENYFNIIMKVFSQLIGKNQKDFDTLLLNKTMLNSTLFELSCKFPNKEIFKTIAKIIHKNSHIIPQLIENRDNVFHISVKEGKPLSILFYYQLFSLYYPDCINCVNEPSKETPLHLACLYGKTDMVQILIDLNAKLNVVNYLGQTPLILAVQNYSIVNAKKLIFFGANKNIKNNSNKTAYEIAELINNTKMMEILKHHSEIQKLIFCKLEFSSMKNKRKDIIFLVFILIIVIFNLAYNLFAIFATIKEGKEQKNISLFNHSTYFMVTQLILCLLYLICFLLILIEYRFKSILKEKKKYQQLKHLLIKKESITSNLIKDLNEEDSESENYESDDVFELYDLYEKYEKVCVKCKYRKLPTTVHCAACDVCVDDFDHHCFWVNSCICKGNKKLFKSFITLIILFFVLEGAFGIYHLLLMRNEKFITFLFKIISNPIVIIAKIVLIFFLSLLALISIGIILIFIIPFLYNVCQEYQEYKKNNREIFLNAEEVKDYSTI